MIGLLIFQRYHRAKKVFYHVLGLQGHEHTAHRITAECAHEFHARRRCPRSFCEVRRGTIFTAGESVSQNDVFLHLSSHFFGKQPHRQQRSTERYEPSLSLSPFLFPTLSPPPTPRLIFPLHSMGGRQRHSGH